MTLNDLRQWIWTRELKIRELFSAAMLLLEQNFKKYMILSILVFLPTNLVTEICMSSVPEQVTLEEYTRICLLFMLVSLFAMIATCTAAVMVQHQLKHDEKLSFSEGFARGFSGWPRFLLTAVLFFILLVFVTLIPLFIGTLMPIMVVPAITAVLIIVVLGSMMIYFLAIISALRRYVLLRNLNYAVSILQGHIGKSAGLFLLLSIVSVLIPLPVISMVDMLMAASGNLVLQIIINTLVASVLSIVNTYVAIAFSVYFLNLELLKQQSQLPSAGIAE